MRLKVERNAVIWLTIIRLGDFPRRSGRTGILALAREAAKASANVIVLCGVHFSRNGQTAESDKTVCLTFAAVPCRFHHRRRHQLCAQYPGIPVITLMPGRVKAESDICCTSANAFALLNRLIPTG
jgi:quinolinate synthase